MNGERGGGEERSVGSEGGEGESVGKRREWGKIRQSDGEGRRKGTREEGEEGEGERRSNSISLPFH